MKENLEKRLAELKAEFESGTKAMAELEKKQTNLRDTLLRISGAIQVLEEAIAEDSEMDKNNLAIETVNGEEATTAEQGAKANVLQ
jgi:hypothetical protein